MVWHARYRWIVVVLATLSAPSFTSAAGVQPLFGLDTPSAGPFPSDHFTVPDSSNNTGLRISLPPPAECHGDPTPRPSACADVETINTLDGFNLQPRLSVPFSGAIDVNSVTSQTVYLLGPDGRRIGIDQVVWDAETNTLHVESADLLSQHSRYVLLVTRGVRDAAGDPIEISEPFATFRHDLNFGQTKDTELKAYRKRLLLALEQAAAAGVDQSDIAVASAFTTQSITSVLEKVRDQIKASTPAPADFFLNGSDQPRTLFAVASIKDIQFGRQVRIGAPLSSMTLAARLPLLVGVSRLAFGKYTAPSYIGADRSMQPIGTRTGVPVMQGSEEIYFNLFLPGGTPPPGGWPVVIHGPGTPDNKNTGTFNVVAAAVARGMAVISTNGPGTGFGPASTLTIVPHNGAAVTFSAGGRSVDENGDGLIGSGVAPTSEGDEFLPRGSSIARRDVYRQAAADLMALVRVIEIGMDVDGDGVPDLDSARIYYQGWSFGAAYGVLFAAVEPNVRALGLNAPGAGKNQFRLSPGNRPGVGRYLARRVPSALNTPGISNFASIATSTPLFNENLPLRDGLPLDVVLSDAAAAMIRSPVINTVPGAIEIQRIIDYTYWALQSNDASAYARHLRRSPLDGILAKSVIIQMNRGDQTVPNVGTSAIIRAGDLADRTMYYRHDLAGQTLKNPHTAFILTNDAAMQSTARALQDQLAIFFESGGVLFTDPDDYIMPAPGQPLFEAPIAGPLPEDLGFIP